MAIQVVIIAQPAASSSARLLESLLVSVSREHDDTVSLRKRASGIGSGRSCLSGALENPGAGRGDAAVHPAPVQRACPAGLPSSARARAHTPSSWSSLLHHHAHYARPVRPLTQEEEAAIQGRDLETFGPCPPRTLHREGGCCVKTTSLPPPLASALRGPPYSSGDGKGRLPRTLQCSTQSPTSSTVSAHARLIGGQHGPFLVPRGAAVMCSTYAFKVEQ